MNWYRESEVLKDKTYGYEPITCPFCQEADFDAIGLKHHLISGGCEAFVQVPAIEKRVRQIKEQQEEFPKNQ